MATVRECPYHGGGRYCKISGCFQSQDSNCIVEEGSSRYWESCPNYQGASEEDKIRKR